MSAEGERDSIAAEFDNQLRNLEQLKASMTATDVRLARLREAIHGLGYNSVAQALERAPADDDTIAAHDSPASAAGLLPWVLVVAVVTVPITYILLDSSKPSATNNRPPDIRSASLEYVTTGIAPRENERALPDVSNVDNALRQPEPSTAATTQAATAQEATTRIAIRSTLPASDDGALPVAPVAALSPPPIATPDSVDTTTSPTALLD